MNNIIRMFVFIASLSLLAACDKKESMPDTKTKESSSVDQYLSTWKSSIDDLSRQENEFLEVNERFKKAAEQYGKKQDEQARQEMTSITKSWLDSSRKLLKVYIDSDKKLSVMMQYAKNSGNTEFALSNSKVSSHIKNKIIVFQSNIASIEDVYAGLISAKKNEDLSYGVMPPTQENIEKLSARLKERQKSVNFEKAELARQFQTAIEYAVRDVNAQYSFELTVGNYTHRIRARDCNQQECFNMATFLVMTQTCAIGIGFEFKNQSIFESMIRRCNGR